MACRLRTAVRCGIKLWKSGRSPARPIQTWNFAKIRLLVVGCASATAKRSARPRTAVRSVPATVATWRACWSSPRVAGLASASSPTSIPFTRLSLRPGGHLGFGIYDYMRPGGGARNHHRFAGQHDRTLEELSDEQISYVLEAYAQRIVDLKRDTRFKCMCHRLFHNRGRARGRGMGAFLLRGDGDRVRSATPSL